MVEQQQRGRAQPGGERHGEEAAVGEHVAVQLARLLPRGGADEHHARGPGRVEHAADLVAPARDAVEVDRVGHAEQHEAADERRPRAPRAQAEHAEQAGDEPQQQQVAGRVGEVGGDGQRVAAGGVEHGAVDERAGDGGEAERDDQPVDPQHPRQPPGAAAREQQQARKAARVEAEVERVGEGRVGDLGRVLEEDRVVELGGSEADHPEADDEPRGALAAVGGGTPQAAAGGEQLDELVQVLGGGRPLRADVGVVEREYDDERRGEREGQAGRVGAGTTHLPLNRHPEEKG